MKKILGLDLGTTSIGWALVNQAENNEEKSSIIKSGVRLNPLTVDEKSNFEKGKSITTNADRTLKRSMRRNLQRYKLRRNALISTLKRAGWINDETMLSENGNKTTFETYRLRAEAALHPISLEDLSRVLLMINKKRGYRSNRKTDVNEGTVSFGGMDIAKELYENNLTPGQYCLDIIKSDKKSLPEFYRSDLYNELDKIWEVQKNYYPDILTDDFKNQISGRGKNDVAKIFYAKYGLTTADNKGKDKKLLAFTWRVDALSSMLSKEQMAYVICEVCGDIRNSSGYLGDISDRSKELIFKGKTVGQYLYENLTGNPDFSTKNKVFYRQDYLDEFEKIWETQARFHNELTPELKTEIRDIIIFYQRNLKSQKGLVSICELEGRDILINKAGKERIVPAGPKVAPRSSLLFQEFKTWQVLNNLSLTDKDTGEIRQLSIEEKECLAKELMTRAKMTSPEALKCLFGKSNACELNYKSLEGNATYSAISDKLIEIVNIEEGIDLKTKNMSTDDIILNICAYLKRYGFKKEILDFDSSLEKQDFEQQPIFKLWHLLYSYVGDSSKTGTGGLTKKISELTGLPEDLSLKLSSVRFLQDYASLSHKAMHKILPFLKSGLTYDKACAEAGYIHSKHSLTSEQIENKKLVDSLEILPKNSLRNPVVEKIINQMIHVVNGIGGEYGRPDEIHIEFARELKQNQQEREKKHADIEKSTKRDEDYKKILETEFNIKYVRKSDILRYRLWLELKENSYKSLYSNMYIPKEKIFTPEVDIEHIIPQSVLFDDSYANKTLEYKSINIEKGSSTARDFILSKYGEDGLREYIERVNYLAKKESISKGKAERLLKKGNEVGGGFINRDLSTSQYIAKKAREILESYVKVVMPTSGSITAYLREDWQLVDIMKELNLDKYRKIGMTHFEEREGKITEKIDEGWTKRNDNRHHAMDAITIAFTKPSHIQYLSSVHAGTLNDSLFSKVGKKKILTPPMPLDELRAAFRDSLSSILVSIKAKNKVATRNENKIKTKNGVKSVVQLTPRSQLHMEQVYGLRYVYKSSFVSVGSSMTSDIIAKVALKIEREALEKRLAEFGFDPKKAFTGKNSLEKNPVYLDKLRTKVLESKVKIVELKPIFTIRKEIDRNLSVEKVLDRGVREILKKRIESFGGDQGKAFSNLDENPIWLNEERHIKLKRVTIGENFELTAIRDKRDKDGKLIKDINGYVMPSDYVNLRNNHHVSIYQKPDGSYEERVVTFFEALDRLVNGLPAVDKTYNSDEGWQFIFSMKINEMFVFPNEKSGFNPKEVDLMNPDNFKDISPNLFRVQKLSSKDYYFRHHLETTVEDIASLKEVTWKRITSIHKVTSAVKVRVDHLGRIVSIGEYD